MRVGALVLVLMLCGCGATGVAENTPTTLAHTSDDMVACFQLHDIAGDKNPTDAQIKDFYSAALEATNPDLREDVTIIGGDAGANDEAGMQQEFGAMEKICEKMGIS